MNEVPTYEWNDDETFLGTTRVRGRKADLYIDTKEADPLLVVVRQCMVGDAITLSRFQDSNSTTRKRLSCARAFSMVLSRAKERGLVP